MKKAITFGISAVVLAFATNSAAFPFWSPKVPKRECPESYCVVRRPFMLPSGKFTEEKYFVKEGAIAGYCSERIREQDIPKYEEANRKVLGHLVAMDICRMRMARGEDYVQAQCPVDSDLKIKNLQRLERLLEQKLLYPQYWR